MATFKTQVVSVAEDGAVSLAVQLLSHGQLVAVPTETVYGLAADATEHSAVQQIFAVKGRPSFNPLICHVADEAMAARFVQVDPTASRLMAAFWPGPLTLVLPALPDSHISEAVSAGLSTIAVRCPAHNVTRTIIKELGRPVAAPSANPSGKLSPTSATDVMDGLGGQIPLVVDGGTTQVGIESTIVAVRKGDVYLLRPGTITPDDIVNELGIPVLANDNSEISAPGQLLSHYAPNASVRLNATTQQANEILIGFGPVAGSLTLSHDGDLLEAAQNLFRLLREADKRGSAIAVAPIPNQGVGIAINDRLKRAAAPRGPAKPEAF